jgi:predicted aspartyl protease
LLSPTSSFNIRALLDTGCLVGGCISKQVVDSLNAFNVTTSICSGFNNQCQNKFRCLKIDLSFLNETTSSFEHFTTSVIVLEGSPINLIIGRETMKKVRLIDRLPSHFVESQNLTVLQKTQESFADNYSEELYGCKPSNQVRTERSHPVKVHAHTCISSLNPDDKAVGFNGPTVNSLKQTRKTNGEASINKTIPLCLCDKASSHGSCISRPDQLLPMHISEGDQMLVTMTEGENENPLLQQVTKQLTTGSAYSLPSENQQKNGYSKRTDFIFPFSQRNQVVHL